MKPLRVLIMHPEKVHKLLRAVLPDPLKALVRETEKLNLYECPDTETAIKQWLANDEVISHSQAVGRSWCLDNSEDVDDLVKFLERAVRGVNAVLEGGISSATGPQAVQEVEVS